VAPKGTDQGRRMKAGDMVQARHVQTDATGKSNIGFVMRVDRSPLTNEMRYWVKLLGGWSVGPFPFRERQLKLVSKSS